MPTGKRRSRPQERAARFERAKNGNGHKHNGHRPAQQRIDRQRFEECARRQYSILGICAEFDVCRDTLERWVHETYARPLADVFDEKRELGHNSIRSKLFAKAEQGHSWAVIWYTKNYMGFADKVQETVRAGKPPEEPQVWEMGDGRRIVFRP